MLTCVGERLGTVDVFQRHLKHQDERIESLSVRRPMPPCNARKCLSVVFVPTPNPRARRVQAQLETRGEQYGEIRAQMDLMASELAELRRLTGQQAAISNVAKATSAVLNLAAAFVTPARIEHPCGSNTRAGPKPSKTRTLHQACALTHPHTHTGQDHVDINASNGIDVSELEKGLAFLGLSSHTKQARCALS